MTEKEIMIHLIKNKGNCTEPIDIDCSKCICDKDSRCPDDDVYEYIINKFIELYGKDELLEIIL